jgi:L-aspartate oxidase
LISEAVRGEGGILRLQNGEAFMGKYDSRKELAPRDVVARAIDKEMKGGAGSFVYLDITAKSRDFLVKRFPNIYAKCLEYGIDISKDMIPVVPAAHYFCGGVAVDENGRTSISNLYAIGETSCTGLHGANRLASNSLLEGIVYAHRAFEDSLRLLNKKYGRPETGKNETLTASSQPQSLIVQEWQEIRRLTWSYLGISRTDEMLAKARKRVDILKEEIENSFYKNRYTVAGIEVRNIVYIAEMIARSAVLRKESRGLHYNADYPKTLKEAKDTVITA